MRNHDERFTFEIVFTSLVVQNAETYPMLLFRRIEINLKLNVSGTGGNHDEAALNAPAAGDPAAILQQLKIWIEGLFNLLHWFYSASAF